MVVCLVWACQRNKGGGTTGVGEAKGGGAVQVGLRGDVAAQAEGGDDPGEGTTKRVRAWVRRMAPPL